MALAVACGGGSSSADEATPDASEQVSTSVTEVTYESVEDEIIARYKAFWQARFAANSPPDPDHPDLAEYATGKQLGQVVSDAEDNLKAGVAIRRADDPVDLQRVTVGEVDGDSAVVRECRVADDVWVDVEDGTVIDDAVETFSVRGEMQRVDGEWQVSTTLLLQRWEGVAGCALAD